MPAGYGTVQKVVMQMPGLSVTSKAVYSLLASYTGGAEWCWPSQAQIAADLKSSRAGVSRALSALEMAGLLKRSKLYGDFRRNTKYKLTVISGLPTSYQRNMQCLTGETFENLTGEAREEEHGRLS
ncbi:MAG: helix-turn-helix domain-containing protein [Spirochaetia bacterium]